MVSQAATRTRHVRDDGRGVRRRIREIGRRLTDLYGAPERERYAPLDELILSILSQNTSDANRDVAYARLRERFPTWEAVRRAPRRELKAAIRPAGLWRQKARVVRDILNTLHAEHGSLTLDHLAAMRDADALRYLTGFRGVGIKTAACVLCFSLGRPYMPVDTHVHRLARRLGLIPPDAEAEDAHEILNSVVPPAERFAFHIQLIRHGRQVCRARKPRCDECVVSDLCPKVGVAKGRR